MPYANSPFANGPAGPGPGPAASPQQAGTPTWAAAQPGRGHAGAGPPGKPRTPTSAKKQGLFQALLATIGAGKKKEARQGTPGAGSQPAAQPPQGRSPFTPAEAVIQGGNSTPPGPPLQPAYRGPGPGRPTPSTPQLYAPRQGQQPPGNAPVGSHAAGGGPQGAEPSRHHGGHHGHVPAPAQGRPKRSLVFGSYGQGLPAPVPPSPYYVGGQADYYEAPQQGPGAGEAPLPPSSAINQALVRLLDELEDEVMAIRAAQAKHAKRVHLIGSLLELLQPEGGLGSSDTATEGLMERLAAERDRVNQEDSGLLQRLQVLAYARTEWQGMLNMMQGIAVDASASKALQSVIFSEAINRIKAFEGQLAAQAAVQAAHAHEPRGHRRATGTTSGAAGSGSANVSRSSLAAAAGHRVAGVVPSWQAPQATAPAPTHARQRQPAAATLPAPSFHALHQPHAAAPTAAAAGAAPHVPHAHGPTTAMLHVEGEHDSDFVASCLDLARSAVLLSVARQRPQLAVAQAAAAGLAGPPATARVRDVLEEAIEVVTAMENVQAQLGLADVDAAEASENLACDRASDEEEGEEGEPVEGFLEDQQQPRVGDSAVNASLASHAHVSQAQQSRSKVLSQSHSQQPRQPRSQPHARARPEEEPGHAPSTQQEQGGELEPSRRSSAQAPPPAPPAPPPPAASRAGAGGDTPSSVPASPARSPAKAAAGATGARWTPLATAAAKAAAAERLEAALAARRQQYQEEAAAAGAPAVL